MRITTLFGEKNFVFFEIYGVSARTRAEEVGPVMSFCGQGEWGANFLRFCADVLYERPLTSINMNTQWEINIKLGSKAKLWRRSVLGS